MKKGKKILLATTVATFAVSSALALASCSGCNDEKLTDDPLTGATLADFTQGEAETFFASDGWCNGDVFNVTWDKKNVAYADNALKLSITDAPAAQAEETEEGEETPVVIPYLGGEARSYQYFGYGDYTVKMKPAKVDGTASAFFVCTGNYDTDEDGNPNPHDEIDIEFLGKDTTKVQFNYFVNGTGGHEYMYDLGFDASLEYHEYGFRWTEDYIVWFVDGKPVHKATEKDDEGMPVTAGRILMNHWCGTEKAEGWMGEYSGSNGATCDYQFVKTSATPVGELPEAPDNPDPSNIPTEGWTDISVDGFDGWANYTVTKTDGLTISHETANGAWACCGMDLTDSYSWVKFNVKNNDTSAATFRIDIKDKKGDKGGISSYYCEEEVVTIDSVASAALVTLDGGQSVEVVLKIKNICVDQLVVFLNSIGSGNPATGSITITNLKGIVNEDVNVPVTPDPVPDGENCPLEFTSTPEYIVDKSGEAATEITVTYTDLIGGKYNNIQAKAATFAAEKDTFSLKITNNGTESVKLRVDLIGERAVVAGDNNALDVCNLSATADGGTDLYTDTTWGGTMITLAANEEVNLVITYSNEGEMGAVQRVQFYLDSATYGDTETYSGNVTFSGFKFTSSKGGDNTEDPDPETPAPFEAPATGWENVPDQLDGWEMYTLERFTNDYYNGVRLISKNTPVNFNDCCGMDLAKSYSYVSFTVKNELGEAAEIRFDFKLKDQEGTGAVVAALPVKYVTVDGDYNAAIVKVGAYQSVNVVIKLDETKEVNQMVIFLNSLAESENPQNGRVILSDIKGICNEEFSTPETVDVPENGWTDISVEGFGGWDNYDVTNDEGLNISHETAKAAWACCGMDLTANYDWIKFTVTNNDSSVAKLRIDVKKNETDTTKPGMVTAAYPAHAATVLKTEKAVALTIGAGESVDVVLKLEAQYFDQMVVFLNSIGNENVAAGDVTIMGLQGIVNSIEHRDPNASDAKNLAFMKSSGSSYSLTPENQEVQSVTVTYENISYSSFQYIRSDIESFAANYNTVTFKVENKGNQEVLLRVGVANEKYDNAREDINVCNISCTPDQASYQDNRGGSYVSVAAGATQTITVKYNSSGNPKQLMIYIDSSKKDDNSQHSGNVVIGEFNFSNS